MKNLARFLGIAALAAAMAFVMTACGPDDAAPPAAAPEAIFFLSADYGAYPDYPISATIREFKPPEGGAQIDLPVTAPYRGAALAADVDILISWFKEDATEGLYAEFKKASNFGKDENGNSDPLAPRVPMVANPETEGDLGTAYEAYLGTITLEEFKTAASGGILDTSSNSSPKGLLYKPAAGRYVAGIAVASKFNEWQTFQSTNVKPDDGTTPSLPKFLFSNTVVIAGSPPSGVAADFVGKWEMGYTFLPAGQGFEAGGYEVLKISDKTFRIFLSQKDEGIQFAISNSSWTELPAGDPLLKRLVPKTKTVDGKLVQIQDGPAADRTEEKTFSKGYKLHVDKVLLNMGYTDYDEFYIYKDTVSDTTYLYRTNGKYNQGKLNDNPYTVVRFYSKRTAPALIPITTAEAEDWTVTGQKAPPWKDPNAP